MSNDDVKSQTTKAIKEFWVQQMRQDHQRALEDFVLKYRLATEELSAAQMAEAIRQACACGDFQRLVCQGDNAQAVVYIPFKEAEALKARIAELEEQIRDANLEAKEERPE